jgi:hypothetical protein
MFILGNSPCCSTVSAHTKRAGTHDRPGQVLPQPETTAARYPSKPPAREEAVRKTAAPVGLCLLTRGS